jgi:8-oxo-dGTP diphosphatase
MNNSFEHPKPSLTVDCVVFGLDESNELRVLLIQRAYDPFAGSWALPGGFVKIEEDLESAARRELEEETAVRDIYIEQLYTFGNFDRDPRGRVVSVAYYALINLKNHPVKASTDAKNAAWFKLDEIPELAFDHKEILSKATERIRAKVLYKPIGFELLPEKFTLSDLQKLYESILGQQLNRRNFRSKMLKMDLLEEAERQTNVSHRPAQLYKFNKKKYEELSQKDGKFIFEIRFQQRDSKGEYDEND